MQKEQTEERPSDVEESGIAETDASDREAAVKLASMESEIASLRSDLSVMNDKYLRKLADEVNFRKRMVREKEDSQRYAVAGLLGDIIPILDDFARAVASAEMAKDYAVLHDGIVLIQRQLGQVLENKYGLRRLESVGKVFDPDLHEAVAIEQPGQAPTGADTPADEPVVAEEFLPGYGLHDRVLRTAKVKVRMPAPKKVESADRDGSDGASGEKLNQAQGQ